MNIQNLEITKEDIIAKAAEKLLDRFETEGMVDRVSGFVRASLTRSMIDTARPKIDALLDEILASIVDKPYAPVNEWGETTGEIQTSLRQMVQAKALDYLSQKVDKDGRPTTYNACGTRAEFMAEQAAKEVVESSCKQEMRAAVVEVRKKVQEQIAEVLAQLLAKP